MAKVTRETVYQRPSEITSACRTLYRNKAFQEITLKDISALTSFSRPSIYNYFQTKEEIFLQILVEEYDKWAESLEKIACEHDSLSLDAFASLLASSLKERETLLKILCMNLYEIEEKSRFERLVDFKRHYSATLSTLDRTLSHFFPDLTADEREAFIYEFLPFMYGLYPYCHPTEKQLEAMKKAGLVVRERSIEEEAKRCIVDLLDRMVDKQ